MDNSACIDHKRKGNKQDYAYQRYKGRQFGMHRLAYAFSKGIDPFDMTFEGVVRHTCDNRRCINPEHLLIGTRRDNSQDMVSRKRQAKGVDCYSSVLSEEEVKIIRESGDTVAMLARRFNVSRKTIENIKSSVSWNHIVGELRTPQKGTTAGVENGNSSLGNNSVLEIRASVLAQRKLAKIYGVSQYCIWCIKNRKTWTHL